MQIRIQCREVVHFDQTIEITEEEWADLQGVTEREMESTGYSPLGDMLDLRDCDGGEFRDVEIFEVSGQQRVWEPAA